MATKAKEGVQLKVRSSSAPSIPRKAKASHGRGTGTENPDRDISAIRDKPMPNYLKPTISSCPDTCRYPKKQQPSESPSQVAGKPLTTRKSIDKAPLPSSQMKERPPKASSPLPRPTISLKPSPDKASKTPKSERTPPLSERRNLSKGTSGATKKREANGITNSATVTLKAKQEEKVILIDIGTDHLTAEAQSKTREAVKSSPPKKEPKDNGVSEGNEEKKEDNMHYDASKESSGGVEQTSKEGDAGKPRAHRGKALLVDSSYEIEARKLKFQRGREVFSGSERGEEGSMLSKRQEAKGKESLPAYNVVIEETASKLAERRNKVKALVGAFETVISLHEPEGQPSPQKGEEEEVKGGGDDQSGQRKEEEAKDGESGLLGQPSQQEGELEMNGGDDIELGQQSQQQEEEMKGKDGGVVSQPQEEGKGTGGNNMTKELTKSTEKRNNTKEELTESSEEAAI